MYYCICGIVPLPHIQEEEVTPCAAIRRPRPTYMPPYDVEVNSIPLGSAIRGRLLQRHGGPYGPGSHNGSQIQRSRRGTSSPPDPGCTPTHNSMYTRRHALHSPYIPAPWYHVYSYYQPCQVPVSHQGTRVLTIHHSMLPDPDTAFRDSWNHAILRCPDEHHTSRCTTYLLTPHTTVHSSTPRGHGGLHVPLCCCVVVRVGHITVQRATVYAERHSTYHPSHSMV